MVTTSTPTKHSFGKLYGIGAGPGDPELITVKGWRLLQQAPVVAFPKGINGQSGVAQQIVEKWLRSEQIHLPLIFPYVQDQEVLEAAWRSAAEQVEGYLVTGQDVVFVSEGDVSFYSTFTYLTQSLQQLNPQIVIETIPGICSPLAAAAVLGIPLTLLNQRLTILPALYTVADLETAIAHADVLVLMKVSSVYEQVWEVLKQYNLLERSYVVERATTAQQVIYANLSDRPQLKLPYFSLLIVQVRSPNAG